MTSGYAVARFNSIKVRLKLVEANEKSVSQDSFNSIKVRLKLTSLIVICLLLRCFNSIKVRLKQVIETITVSTLEVSIP